MYYDIKTHEQHEQHRTVDDVDDVNPCYGQGSDGTLHPTKYNCRSYTVHSVTLRRASVLCRLGTEP